MQNLEQVRARNALKLGPVAGDKGGEVIKKVAPLILNHGLLATAAYSFTEKEGWQKVFDAIACHLADRDIAIVPGSVTDRQTLMTFLTDRATTSETLKLATHETMAWLAFARRFSRKG
ncbi:MAG: type III-B CRISPR module-associated protein Cmr5 [Limisphaerales bacterium]